MNILDIVTASIILICVIICYARGLLISIFNLLSFFLSFVLTRRLYPYAAAWLRTTPLFESFKQTFHGWISGGAPPPDTGQIITDAVNSMQLPEIFKGIMLDNISSAPGINLADAYNYAAEYTAVFAMDAIAIVLVFVSVFLIMRIITQIIKAVSRLPVIRTFDHVGGGVMGFIIGSLLSWLTLSVMNGLFAASMDFPVTDLLAGSMFAKHFLFRA